MEHLITAEVIIRAVVEIPLRRFKRLQEGDKHEHEIMTLDLKHRLGAFQAEVQELFNTKPEEVIPEPPVSKAEARRRKALLKEKKS